MGILIPNARARRGCFIELRTYFTAPARNTCLAGTLGVERQSNMVWLIM
jgi:hypothetical protein